MDKNTQPPKTLPAFIWDYTKPFKWWFLLFTFCALAAGLWAGFNAILIKNLINDLSGQGDYAVIIAMLIMLNLFMHELYWRIMQYINYRFQLVIQNNIISDTFKYINAQSSQFFQDYLSTRVARQVMVLADNIAPLVHEHSRHIVRGIALLCIALTAMYNVHFGFFLGLLSLVIVFSVVGFTYSRKLIVLSENQANAESIVYGQVGDSLANASNVRLFSKRSYEINRLTEYLEAVKIAYQKKEWFSICLHTFLGTSMAVMLGFMAFLLIYLKKKNAITIGDVALILNLSLEVAWMLWYTLEQIDSANKAIGKCTQAMDFLFKPISIVDAKNASMLSVPKGQIQFQDVHFHYTGAEPLFQNKSVLVERGQKVGLVGYSGGGKTTFVNLILRLYDVTGGRILIDDQDIRDVTQDSLRSQIAMIPQDPSLFHRSLMDNIRYGRTDALDTEVIAAAKKAHAHEFIEKLPGGYDSLVGERGVKLSGGQRQRIAIARAILKNAPILILDEATSQLDSVTESFIQDSLWELMQGKTTLVIAHRLSTLLHMDRILVFDQGKIVEDGTHTQLLATDGLYKTLWDAQVGGFLPD